MKIIYNADYEQSTKGTMSYCGLLKSPSVHTLYTYYYLWTTKTHLYQMFHFPWILNISSNQFAEPNWTVKWCR